MKAVIISQPGGPEVLVLADRPQPVPAAHEVLIRVAAAGINRADLVQREGHYSAPAGVPADILGLEVAGVVEHCGAAVTRWKTGDAVCALVAGGGYAQFAVVDASHCLPVPEGVSLTDAAALPEAVLTVWSNVFQRGRLKSGETFLVHGGTSGIGMIAIQLAKAWGARVFATAGSDEKCLAAKAAGADRVINYKTDDFEQALKADGVDVVLDMVGGDYLAKNVNLLRPEGRLVFISAMGGSMPTVNLMQVMANRLTITGSMLRSREPEFKASLTAEVEREVWPLLAAGKLHANVFATFDLADASEAHRLMASSQHIGKIVLKASK